MPGLNSANLEWQDSRVSRYIEAMQRVYDDFPNSGLDEAAVGSFYIPYQITLHILQELYFQFERAMEEDSKDGSADDIIGLVRSGKLTAKNPKSRSSALKTSLRAIAYFSSECESRIFLVRRVFPSYFDFLSVSHIPEGWGVSSKMLEELQEEFRKKKEAREELVNGEFFKVVDMEEPENFSFTLPYVAEQKRLKYGQVPALPVFREERAESDRDMLGAFLFFVSGADGVPMSFQEEEQFRSFSKPLCDATSKLINAHKAVLEKESLPLAKHWRDISKEPRFKKSKTSIAEVVLHCNDHADRDGICPGLEHTAREFLQLLTIQNYYAIRDTQAEKERKGTAVFLVTPKHDFHKDFKTRLLRIVAERLSDNKIHCHVEIKVGASSDPKCFDLQAHEE